MSSSPVPPLTDRQRDALRSIVHHMEEHGVAPSVVELSGRLGLKHGMASYAYLGALESKGYVRRVYGRARSIVVLRDEDGAEVEQKATGSETPT